MENKKQDTMLRFRKKPRRKLIGGLILLVVLSGLYAACLMVFNIAATALSGMETKSFQLKTLSKSLEKAYSMQTSVYEDIMNRHELKVLLEAASCSGLISEGIDLSPCMYQDGAIISISDGSVEYPPDFPDGIRIGESPLEDPAGMCISSGEGEDGGPSAVYYARIEGPLFYIEWMPYAEMIAEQRELFNFEKAIEGVEKAFNVQLLLFPADRTVDGKHVLVYTSEALVKDDFIYAEDYGITQEMISEAVYDRTGTAETEASGDTEGSAASGMPGVSDVPETQAAGNANAGLYRVLTVGDGIYELYLQKYNSSLLDGASVLACLVPMESSLHVQTELGLIILAVFFIIGVFFLVWYFSNMRLVRDHSLNDSQKQELNFKAIIKRSCSILAIGCVIILTVSAMLFALVRLYSTCRQVESAFSVMQQRIGENAYASGVTESTRKKTYEGFAKQISRILESQPDYVTEDSLQVLCDLIDADYIMLFDDEGNETISNSRHIGLSLGSDPSSSTYDFRRLLTGTELITHDLAVDEATGEEHVMIGVCFGTPEEEENYGALLLAVPGDKIYDSTAESIDDVMSSLAVGGLTAFSADPESHLVLHASDPSLVGKNILDLGLPETALSSGCQDFFNIDQKSYYVECEELDSAFYFYAADQANLYKGIGMQAVYTSAAAAVLFAILAVFLLIGYGKFFAVWSDVGEELKDEDDEVLISGIRRKYSLDPSKRWRPDAIVHGIHSPFRTASFVVAVLLVTAILFLGTRLIFSGSGSGDSLIAYIIRGNWTKGVNLFAFTSILIRLCEVLIAVVLIKLLLHLVSSALGTKGETICRLLTNLTSYCGVLFFVYFALYDLGFQPNTLLASLGLLSFAVSLGAKDLITDVIAGLSIVFEGEYQVGDIIDVAGYRGEVLEIGVRTTKLKGSGGNIKIISNRDIKNVINMTRLNSWCPLDVSVSSDQPLNTIEDLLRAQLPAIGKSIPEIVSGPFYKGVAAMGKGTVTLSIVAECNEGDYYTIQRNLNRAIQELFEQNGIKIM